MKTHQRFSPLPGVAFGCGLRPRCEIYRLAAVAAIALFAAPLAAAPDIVHAAAFTEKYCANCHNDVDREGELDLTSLMFAPGDPANFQTWVKVHDRVQGGEMPPKEKKRPEPSALAAFVKSLNAGLVASEQEVTAREGRATARRLNREEYENALRDLFQAPWLHVKSQLPEDGEAFRSNKVSNALDVSHVHVARYMSAAEFAIRQVLSAQFERPAPATRRYYARDQDG
ncbi:MAG: DUF1587 domain-containing protein, partial [Opitutaceae bacterium]